MAQNKNKVPAQNTPSTSHAVKTAWKKSGKSLSLKRWVSQLRANNAPSGNDLVQAALAWLKNKKANTSKPQQGIGRTNRIGKGNKK